ncbi:MAG: SMI1/KNR4 family protein, partial [Chitinophagaceae bacterium]
PLPDEVRAMLRLHDGETSNGNSPFFDQKFMSTQEIIDQLKFSRTLVKPENRTIDNPSASEALLRQIIDGVKAQINTGSWYKVEFGGSSNSFSKPALYKYESTTGKEKEFFDVNYEEIVTLIEQLHALEKTSYNWDELKIIFYHDGRSEIKREDYGFNDYIGESMPPDTVKRIYFHYKWVPVFSDGGGNYIGVDLDPDSRGVKGQVIVYGRDVDQNYRVAENLSEFFDKIIIEINKEEGALTKNKKHHFQERLKAFI